MSLLNSLQTDEQKLLVKISKDIGEPVTISIVDYYPDEKRVRFDFLDNWHISIEPPDNFENLSDEAVYQRFISMVKHIRADQLKGIEKPA